MSLLITLSAAKPFMKIIKPQSSYSHKHKIEINELAHCENLQSFILLN
jgi:hypothetical protein